MEQSDKILLIKDLSARLFYGVLCKVTFDDGTSDVMKLSQFPDRFGIWGFCKEGYYGRSDNFIPYLRPMSSMTEEEYQEFGYDVLRYTPREFDWLNAHHFDYRGLIEKGLAIEAPEGMYK